MPQIAEKVCTFETFRLVALSLWRESRHDDARLLLEDCLRRGDEISSERIVALSNTLGVVEWSEKNYDKALRILYATDALLDFASLTLQGRVYNNRGMLHYTLGQGELAKREYLASLDCHRRADAYHAAQEVKNNLAALAVSVGKPEEAFPYLDSLLAECDNKLIIAQAEDTRASALLAQARYREAYEASLRSLNLLKEFPEEIKPLQTSLGTMKEICIRLTTEPSAEQVRDALDASSKSISRAAHLLGLDHSSLAHLIRKKYPELKDKRRDPLQPRGAAARKAD